MSRLLVLFLPALVFLPACDDGTGKGACTSAPFDRTFDVTTTCGGDHAGRIHVAFETAETSRTFTGPAIEQLSGDLPLTAVGASGFCQDGSPVEWRYFYLQFDTGGGKLARCSLDVLYNLGATVVCELPSVNESCTAKLVDAPL